jgi:hypothetical protein
MKLRVRNTLQILLPVLLHKRLVVTSCSVCSAGFVLTLPLPQIYDLMSYIITQKKCLRFVSWRGGCLVRFRES